jgi:hypothetical protein
VSSNSAKKEGLLEQKNGMEAEGKGGWQMVLESLFSKPSSLGTVSTGLKQVAFTFAGPKQKGG